MIIVTRCFYIPANATAAAPTGINTLNTSLAAPVGAAAFAAIPDVPGLTGVCTVGVGVAGQLAAFALLAPEVMEYVAVGGNVSVPVP